MDVSFSPSTLHRDEAWIEVNGRNTGFRVRFHADGGMDLVGPDGKIAQRDVTKGDAADAALAHVCRQEDERLAGIERLKADCGYVRPPAHLVPDGLEAPDAEWDRLLAWFKQHTTNAGAAILVCVAERCRVDTFTAYVMTDGYFKRLSAREEDEEGRYVSHN